MVLRYQIRTCGKTRETTPQPKRESHVAEIPSHKEMHSATLLAAAVAGLAGSAAAVTVHGALVFTRHGDRETLSLSLSLSYTHSLTRQWA